MAGKRIVPGLKTVACDFTLSLAVFIALIAAAATHCGADVIGFSALASELPWPPDLSSFDLPIPPEFVAMQLPDPADHVPALLALAVSAAASTALNLWFIRHLRRAYIRNRR